MQQKVIETQNIGMTVKNSSIKYRDYLPQPQTKPNILYIVLDDLGFSHLGCYGSNINTPNIDKLAYEGLRYNNFHTTAVCTASRACLLTGANHHQVGICAVCDNVTGYPNAQGFVSNEYATTAEILKEFDYGTYCVGKWHLSTQDAAAGPYDQWPIARGFDRYYGFLHAETSQFNPPLTRDNSPVQPDKTSQEGYHFTEDAIDNAIDYLFNHEMANPSKPFFMYLALGAMHAPHHAPKEYIEKYKGKFDSGWDAMRELWLNKQKEMGVVPHNVELSPRNEHVSAWDDLSPDRKKLYAKYMEAFAGMLEHTDDHIGRLLDYLREIDKLDNTVIVFLSDNGASGEGGKQGRFNFFSGLDVTSEFEDEYQYALEHIDEIGSVSSFSNYPTGWANAGNTPFSWYKFWAYEGGIQDPLIIRYPDNISAPGKVRNQYMHISDITPTILDIMGVDKPMSIKGVAQKPFSGISAKYTFEDENAKSRRLVQYYEVMGNRGIYKDGWKAVTNHTFSAGYESDVWELYNVEQDFTECNDVAAKYPDKLRELQDQFMIEAGKYQVFPMLPGTIHANPGSVFRCMGDELRMPEGEICFKNVIKPYDLSKAQKGFVNDWASHSVTVDIERDSSLQEGVLLCMGDMYGGSVLYIKDNKLIYAYNRNQLEYYTAVSNIAVPQSAKVAYDFDREDALNAQVTIYIDDIEVGKTMVSRLATVKGHTATLKANRHTPVVPEYKVPFEFDGKICAISLKRKACTVNMKHEVAKAFSID